MSALGIQDVGVACTAYVQLPDVSRPSQMSTSKPRPHPCWVWSIQEGMGDLGSVSNLTSTSCLMAGIGPMCISERGF